MLIVFVIYFYIQKDEMTTSSLLYVQDIFKNAFTILSHNRTVFSERFRQFSKKIAKGNGKREVAEFMLASV